MEYGSKEVSKAAIRMALTDSREAENHLKEQFEKSGIKAVAVDFGGECTSAVAKVLERAVVAARRGGVIQETHTEEGAVAGAAHEAMTQVVNKAMGLNLGGKIAIARFDSHLSVCVFFAIGLLNLNDVAIGLGHRAL